MTRYIVARVIVTLVGIVVWGYGQHVDNPQVRVGGMVILGVALLMRFARKKV
jgi:hypothetical protein